MTMTLLIANKRGFDLEELYLGYLLTLPYNLQICKESGSGNLVCNDELFANWFLKIQVEFVFKIINCELRSEV